MRSTNLVGLHGCLASFGCKEPKAGFQIGLISKIFLYLHNNQVVNLLQIGFAYARVIWIHYQIGPDRAGEQLITLPVEKRICHRRLAAYFVEDGVKPNFLFSHFVESAPWREETAAAGIGF